jgi:hypothetical protein
MEQYALDHRDDDEAWAELRKIEKQLGVRHAKCVRQS